MKLIIENVAPGGPARSITIDGRTYPVLACSPADGGMTETYELEGEPPTASAVDVHVQGPYFTSRDIAGIIQQAIVQHSPGRTA